MNSEENTTEATEPVDTLTAATTDEVVLDSIVDVEIQSSDVVSEEEDALNEANSEEIVEGLSEEVTEEEIDETLAAVGADAEVLTTDQVAKMVLNEALDGFKSGVSNLNECVTVEENTTGATCTSRSAMKVCTKSDSIEGSRDVMVVITVKVL